MQRREKENIKKQSGPGGGKPGNVGPAICMSHGVPAVVNSLSNAVKALRLAEYDVVEPAHVSARRPSSRSSPIRHLEELQQSNTLLQKQAFKNFRGM